MNYDKLKIGNQLCFPLYACSREIVRLYKPFLDEIGLTYTQYIAMMVLWERKQLTVKQLGEILYLDSGTLTPLLKKMESSGLLSRSRDKADERSVIVKLTDQGEELKEQAVLIPEKISKCVPLDQEESKQLYHLLYKILGNSSRNPEK
ncbi:MarR family winged helix-turn-helix transcriptional regulator [Lacrimispora algidixylanolytica]|uniref:MarR family transcriptional regulator n=1 Tax=Lacrimispora algidixylanolytica TaxID=94868 RepID=A0A419T7A2_9FIRM|nr:MarR family transcriptional regulator [Lacrimispora algidixylanolytica]RKD33306.1 MarR family transcriptional regulator [Lacrimispora algidixylanolytica]